MLLRAPAPRLCAEKPACNRRPLARVLPVSAFASALTCLFPNSGENTAKDLARVTKMPLNCFSSEITEPRRAGDTPPRGQPGWGGRLGSLPLLRSPGPGQGEVVGRLAWSRASSANGNCKRWGRDGHAGISFPAISSSHPSVQGTLCARFLQARCWDFCVL